MNEKTSVEILNNCIFGAFTCIMENGYPMTVPMIFTYYENAVYLHISNSGDLYNNLLKNNKVNLLVYGKRDDTGTSPWAIYDSVIVYGTSVLLDPLNPDQADEAKRALIELSLKCNMTHKAVYADDYIKKFGPRCAVVKIKIDHMAGRYLNIH